MNALAVFGAAIRMESNSERSQHLFIPQLHNMKATLVAKL